jgi:hypothetical protein
VTWALFGTPEISHSANVSQFQYQLFRRSTSSLALSKHAKASGGSAASRCGQSLRASRITATGFCGSDGARRSSVASSITSGLGRPFKPAAFLDLPR